MIQRGLDVGILVTWTKSFNCPSVVGRDAVQMLRDAINRRGDTHVEVLAVLNDTTGKFVYINELEYWKVTLKCFTFPQEHKNLQPI